MDEADKQKLAEKYGQLRKDEFTLNKMKALLVEQLGNLKKEQALLLTIQQQESISVEAPNGSSRHVGASGTTVDSAEACLDRIFDADLVARELFAGIDAQQTSMKTTAPK